MNRQLAERMKNSVLAIVLCAAGALPAMAFAEVASVPLFVSQKADPLVMLVLSNDHQLYLKAYSDYDDVNGDGTLDTTYDDDIDYYGYFDSDKCYVYDGGADRFEPNGAVQGSSNHACGGGGEWSGNFLNWASMTRMDVLRKVLFGGKRSTDTAGETVLERVFLPRDIHAFAKVFAPANGGADVRRFTPYSAYDSITICNVSDHGNYDGDSQYSNAEPELRVARGSWPVWAAGEQLQCQWNRSGTPDDDDHELATLTARVEVCVDGMEEDNCKEYSAGTEKPTGLLQTYGEADDDEAVLRLGLLSGSYERNRSGGVLRKNIVRISGNGNGNDEIDPATGIFINQDDNDAGVINTISRFRISEWSGSVYEDCDTHSISVDELDENSDSRRCANWGNPVGEMYLETLRYLAGETQPTNAFDTSDADYIPNLPKVDWDDPYEDANWCARPNVILMSTGLNSFDIDQYSTVTAIPEDDGTSLTTGELDALVDEIGDQEGITGNSYFIGDNGSNSNELCDAKTIGALSDAKGICPETPNQQGGYDVAGLAWHARTNDLRPGLARGAGNGQNRPPGHEVNADTYALALAQGLPRITVNGMTFLPACQSNTNGNAHNGSGGWLNCSLADLRIVDLDYDAGGNLVAGNLLYQWEDSSWGNDYDLDGMERIEFCAGSACSPAIDADQVRLTVSSPYANAGNALRFGFSVTGSTNDGIAFNVIRDGGETITCLNSDLTTSGDCSAIDSDWFNGQHERFPQDSTVLTAGTSSGDILEPPLWYAAKYGMFDEDPEDADGIPGTPSEWDENGDGVPDGYFQVTDPAELIAKLGSVFESIMKTSSSAASVATNSTRLDVDTVVYQARFNSEDWRGHLLAFDIESEGGIGAPKWDAAELVPAHNQRDIFTWNPDADTNDDGTADGIGRGFLWANLSVAQQAALNTSPDNVVDAYGDERLAWLRGDPAMEQRNGGMFRDRNVTVLGDIVNSDPFFIGTPDYRYHLLPNATEAAAYTAFRSSAGYQGRTRMLYVGANDGMLHAFNANTGAEMFSYVPNLVYDRLAELPDPDYTHRYFVDGSPRAGDAYVKGSWRTVLVGTLGAGGAGVFALDVTNPDTFGANDVLWEYTDADLGRMSGQATLIRLNDGKWYVLFGNGFESPDGRAVLYLVDLESAEATRFVVAGGPDNGLATPVPVDTNGDRVTDLVYAGDLKGNLWKFDFTGNSNQWGVAFRQGQNAYPLFTATDADGNPQPVTQRPAVGVHPDGGYMVYFGTGSFYAEGDNVVTATPDVQTFYGVRDNDTRLEDSRDDLQRQTIDAELFLAAADVRVVSNHSVDYVAKHGWYIDLVSPNGAEGERSVANPVLRGDRIIFTTLIPSSEACDFGGTGWLMELDAINGRRLPYTVLDVNDDGVFDEEDFASVDGTDYPVSGMRSSVGIIKSPGIISAGDKEYKYASGSTGEIAVISERNSLDTGRKSWREIR